MLWGTIHESPGKQNLNTKRSTEAEVIGTSEYFPYNICLLLFLLKQ